MAKSKVTIIGGINILVLSAVMIYLTYFSTPAPIPTNEQLMEKMNQTFPSEVASVIQDTIYLDERHVFVPFITKENEYGASYWIWSKWKWKVVSIDIQGYPRIWKVNKKDPATYQLVWNINHGDLLSYMKFYLIRDRGYWSFDGIDEYDPRIQMEEEISLQEKSYGVLPLPEEWASLMDSLIKVESVKQPDPFWGFDISGHPVYFGLIPYDSLDKVAFPEPFGISRGYSNGNVEIDFVRMLDEKELELPHASLRHCHLFEHAL